MNLETKITIYKFTPQLFTLTREVFCFCNKSGGWFVNYGINRNNSPYEKNNPHTDCYTYLF